MSTKENLRVALAALASVLLTVTLTACSNSGYGSDANPKTSAYLLSAFTDGQFLDPYQNNKPDFGGTMEAIVQLSGVGYTAEKLSKPITWLNDNTDQIQSAGLKGEYIFTAKALGFDDEPFYATALADLKKAVAADGSIADTNNFSYCWVILGLAAANETELADKVAFKLSQGVETNGGYKYMTGAEGTPPSADVTGFSILALLATEGFGTSEDEAAKKLSIEKAKNWIIAALDNSDHFNAYGDVDISSTAYAAMALSEVDVQTDKMVAWLISRVNSKNGGLIAPWTDPESDSFSTTQSILAMSKLSFLDVLEHSKN